jgi:hypothetical protein
MIAGLLENFDGPFVKRAFPRLVDSGGPTSHTTSHPVSEPTASGMNQAAPFAERTTARREAEAMIKVGWLGLEPRTNALKGRCSTIELPTRSEPQFLR